MNFDTNVIKTKRKQNKNIFKALIIFCICFLCWQEDEYYFLTIKKVTREEAGMFSVKASNVAGTMSASARLKVIRKFSSIVFFFLFRISSAKKIAKFWSRCFTKLDFFSPHSFTNDFSVNSAVQAVFENSRKRLKNGLWILSVQNNNNCVTICSN